MKECEEILKLHNELLKSDKHPFTPKYTTVNVSKKHGVYIIYSPDDVVLHVSSTQRGEGGLNQRLFLD